ncbi:hypothetical protein VKT23_010753 [Stygiomarasmius scandens]|uniref:F-box domain-containing protein n=1 Tax=Marasmiellus scandens TaxID=2682957 RepID=A0ABR1JF91_9AGAR
MVKICRRCNHSTRIEPVTDNYLRNAELMARSQIWSTLHSGSSGLAYYNEEIEYTESVLNTLKAEKKLLQTLLGRLSVLEKNFIRWLPSELLMEVFLWCCVSGNNPTTERHPTFVLSHVCSRWRNIALSTPKLWSRLGLHLSTGKDGSVKRLLSMCYFTELFLERSGETPLDVALEVPSRHVDAALEWDFEIGHMDFRPVDKIVKLFYNQSHRWRTASLSAFGPYFEDFLPWPRELPILETLQLDAIWLEDDDDYTYAVLKRIEAPRLTSLTLLGDWGPPEEDDEKDPTDFFDCSLLETLVNAYDLSYNLNVLSMAKPSNTVILKNFVTQTMSNPIIVICRAKTLIIEPIFNSEACTTLADVVATFELPNVCEVHFGRARDYPLYDTQSVIDELAMMKFPVLEFCDLLSGSSASTITHFSLHHYIIDADDLIQILWELPSLTHFSFDERPGDTGLPSVLSYLKYSMKANEFFFRMAELALTPRLVDLSLAFNPCLPFPGGHPILDMVESRWNRSVCSEKERVHLTRVRLLVPLGKLDATDYGRIQRLGNEGLHLEMGSCFS